MSCHGPPGEDVDDDDREFLEAAQEDVALAANLLMCLSRRETYVPWWRPQEPPPSVASPSTVTGGGVVDFHRTLCNWGCRRWRSRGIAREGISTAKMEDARRASPTTPLSWSGGGSGTSGSVCEDGWGVQPRPQKRQMERSLHEQGESSKPPDSAPGRPKAELQNGAETVQPSPSKRPKSEGSENGGEDRAPASTWMKTEAANVDAALRVFIPLEPSAVRSSPVAGSNKEVVVAPTAAVPVSSIPAARPEPMRLRLAADAAGPAASRRTGKKKTLPELKVMEESLLRDRVELRKALEEQKKILVILREENLKMTKLKSDLAEAEKSKSPLWSPGARKAVEEDVSGPAGEARQGLLIDLNCMPEEEDQ